MVDRSEVFWQGGPPSPSDPRAPELDLKCQTWAWILGCQLLEAIWASEGGNEGIV